MSVGVGVGVGVGIGESAGVDIGVGVGIDVGMGVGVGIGVDVGVGVSVGVDVGCSSSHPGRTIAAIRHRIPTPTTLTYLRKLNFMPEPDTTLVPNPRSLRYSFTASIL